MLAALALASSAQAVAATPARAHDTLTLAARHVNGAVGAVIGGASWQVNGTITPYVSGQRIAIHAFDGVGQRIVAQQVRITRHGRTGVFKATFRVPSIGKVTVRAIHYATATQGWLVSPDVSVWVVAPQVQPNQQSLAARILQAQLSAQHYVVGATGVYDDRTQRAVLAFRKMVGLDRTSVADASVFAALAAGEGAFSVRFPSHGRHVEGDLTHQVLALIGANGSVEALYPMSSGKPSTPTALGSFRVYSKTFGVNNVGMVDSNYFNGGDAIHGYPEVPTYAASHGCLRVPIPDALTIYDWVAIGTPVDVYYR